MKNLSVPSALALLLLASSNSNAKQNFVKIHGSVSASRSNHSGEVHVFGEWRAETKTSGYDIRFYHADDNTNWSSSSSFSLSEIKKINTEYQYTIVRDAGQLLMTGNFDGSKGDGKYDFVPDAGFEKKLSSAGITHLTLKNKFSFFLLNVKQDYLVDMAKSGYAIVSASDLITFSANRITPEYIDMLAGFGYRKLRVHELISARSSGIDSIYLSTLGKDKLQSIPIMDLISARKRR